MKSLRKIVLGNLDTVRDFTYVGDTVEAFLLGGTVEGVEGQVFNLGSNSEITIGNIVQSVCKIIGREKQIRSDGQRKRPEKSEVLRLRSDYTKAKEKLGWQPTTCFDKGLMETINWIQKNPQGYLVDQYVI